MKCQVCGKAYFCIKKYMFHMNFIHKKFDYSCPFNKCNRLYPNKSAFNKHIKRKHHQNIPTVEGEIVINDLKVQKNKKIELKEDASSELPKLDSISQKDYNLQLTEEYNIFKDILQNSLQVLLGQFYDNLTLTRAVIQNVIDAIGSFLSSGFIESFKRYIEITLKKHNLSLDNNASNMLELIEFPFVNVNTEYKRLQLFEKSNCFIKPVPYSLGTSLDVKKGKGETSRTIKTSYGYLIPLDQTLKSFLELPGVFDTILEYHNKLVKDFNYTNFQTMTNLVHGTLWKPVNEHAILENKIIFPLVMYFDDYDVGNPLGSHAGCYKIGGVYYTLSSIPPQYASRLENIFLACTFYSSDRVQFGNEKVFTPLIEQLQMLESKGIKINVANKCYTVFFVVVAITGDNLGLHSILGCFESFSAHYSCRVCTVHKTERLTQVEENELLLRKKENYEDDLTELKGIKERCIWNKLTYFHVYDNLVCDIMHDFFEGIHRYEMAVVINYFIDQHFFSLMIYLSE